MLSSYGKLLAMALKINITDDSGATVVPLFGDKTAARGRNFSSVPLKMRLQCDSVALWTKP